MKGDSKAHWHCRFFFQTQIRQRLQVVFQPQVLSSSKAHSRSASQSPLAYQPMGWREYLPPHRWAW